MITFTITLLSNTEKDNTMSKLYYDIQFTEEYYDTEEAKNLKLPQKEIRHNIPHAKEINDWIPKEWNDMHMERFFDDILKDKVQSCIMKPMSKTVMNKTFSYGRVTITFIPGFRLSEAKRQACWEQLDAQMTYGFGETFDGQRIPNTPDGWCIQF